MHLPGGPQGGLLLAKPDGRPLLHADSPELLLQLRLDWPAHPRPTAKHSGAIHRCPSAGHPAHDGPDGVAE